MTEAGRPTPNGAINIYNGVDQLYVYLYRFDTSKRLLIKTSLHQNFTQPTKN